VLHTVFQWAVENRELRPDNSCTRKTKPKRGDEQQPVILTADQIEPLLKECEHHPMLKLWVLMNADTWMRVNSEPLWLRWEDVDLARCKLHIVSGRDCHRTKTGKSRAVPITTERLLAALKAHFTAYRFGGSP
jgi:integrase